MRVKYLFEHSDGRQDVCVSEVRDFYRGIYRDAEGYIFLTIFDGLEMVSKEPVDGKFYEVITDRLFDNGAIDLTDTSFCSGCIRLPEVPVFIVREEED